MVSAGSLVWFQQALLDLVLVVPTFVSTVKNWKAKQREFEGPRERRLAGRAFGNYGIMGDDCCLSGKINLHCLLLRPARSPLGG